MKNVHEVPRTRSLRRTVVRVGMFIGLVASVVLIARLITGHHQGSR